MGNYVSTITSLSNLLVGHSFSAPAEQLAIDAIDLAEGEVNSYMSKRYDVGDLIGASTTTPLLVTCTKLIACSYYLKFNSRSGKESLTKAEVFYESAINLLKSILEGETDLLDANGDVIADKADGNFAVYSNTKDYSNTFNEDTSTSWVTDSDKLSDIGDERSG